MADMQELIRTILSTAKQSENGSLSKVYRDEPILMTAAQMKNFTPPRYREMRRIAKEFGGYYEYDARVFYEQGKFMEAFEDDFEYDGGFSRYFPTYQTMNDHELRGYFSWRTKVRQGNVEKTSLSFAFVYLYELLNQIGVSSPEEALRTLKDFWTVYRALDPQIDPYVKRWLNDFVVYHNLDRSFLEEDPQDDSEGALLVLIHYDAHSVEEVFSALTSLSTYRLEKSGFFKQRPEEVRAVVYRVFSALSEFYGQDHKYNLCEKLFGRFDSGPYSIFRSAVFYDHKGYTDFVYEKNEIHKYRCVNGRWRCERSFGNVGKSRQVGALLKNIDRLMRQAYRFKPDLKEEKTSKVFLKVIEQEIEADQESRAAELRRQTQPKIEIDRSKLRAIREAALQTQNKLIVEAEGDEAPELLEAIQEQMVDGTVSSEAGASLETGVGLDEIESQLLSCLLSGRTYDQLLKSRGLMLSVVIDAINEKLFDTFGDTVLLWNGDQPELIEDYIEELKGMIGE